MRADHIVARGAVAPMFVHGGYATLRDPGPRAAAAAPFLAAIRRRVPALPPDLALVRLNAAVHLVGGAALAAGVLPRAAATLLAASLIPTTAAGHGYWRAADPQLRGRQFVEFTKNAAALGALVLIAADGR